MSFELGFIKRAMEYGLCYVDAELLYKQAAQPLANQDALNSFQTGFNGKPPTEPVRSLAGHPLTNPAPAPAPTNNNSPGFMRNLAGAVGNAGYELFVAPPVDAVKQLGDTWDSARSGQWGNALASGGKALGNIGLTALNFTPGLGLGAVAAKAGLGAAARGTLAGARLFSNANKVRKLEQVGGALGQGAKIMGNSPLRNMAPVVQRYLPYGIASGEGVAREFTAEEPNPFEGIPPKIPAAARSSVPMPPDSILRR